MPTENQSRVYNNHLHSFLFTHQTFLGCLYMPDTLGSAEISSHFQTHYLQASFAKVILFCQFPLLLNIH